MSARDAKLLLILWIAVDIVFIALHTAHACHLLAPQLFHPFFNIQDDRSGGEAIQYAKALWIALAFLLIALLRRSAGYVPWALLFTYIVLDDVFQLHELLGRDIAIALDYPELLGLRPDDLGELTFYAIALAVILPLLAAAYLWGSREFRTLSVNMAILLVVLGVFGVVFDMAHIMVTGSSVEQLAGVLEDGGEMIVMSVIAAFALVALGLARQGSPRESPSLTLSDEPNGARSELRLAPQPARQRMNGRALPVSRAAACVRRR
jgi:hypothetical protein